MQIEDILKAAIKDAGLESNLEILNETQTTQLTINTNDFSVDDDFNLNDLDFSILNPITPPQSTSPSTSSLSSNSNHLQTNNLIPDDSDPFLIALKELDDNERLCSQQQPKIIQFSKTNNDLLSLLNYRNIPQKQLPIVQNRINQIPKCNPSIKVINLSQIQQQQQTKLNDKIAPNHKLIQITNRSVTNPIIQNNANNIKITKVVSSRPVQNSNQNLIYINKSNNVLNSFTTRTNTTVKTNIKQPPTMRLVGNNNLNNISNQQPVQYITKIAAPTNNIVQNNVPRFYAKPTRIITTANLPQQQQQQQQQQIKPELTQSNSHINILNSNISRYLNQSKLNSTPNPVTINPKYLPNTPEPQIQPQLNNNYQNYFEPDEDVVVEEEEELGHAETYANYMPSKLKIGHPHPDPIVETSSLASVEPPDVWYNLKMPETVFQNSALSALQLETIVYACQKHQEFLSNSHRCGFLVGDGAGVGKGRTIAGMIYENYLIGRKKALWLSVSNDLKFDSQRDLADIGASKIQVHSLNKLKYCKISSKQNNKIKKGVIFSTYSSLIGESQHKATKKKYNSRLKQLIQWLGGKQFDGLIIFDECHKAKNLVPVGSAKPTKTGLAVLELQEKLPNARIVYASATGASEPKNMAYMVRLGLWGNGTPFVDFNDFIQSIEKRGVGAMEIVAMDMKLRGMYIARQLSFSGVTFKIEEIPLKKDYVKMYNDAVKLWVEMKEKFQEAIDLIDTEGKLKKTVWGQFWSSHQRFFKYLCMACKVPHVVELAKNALKNKKCVVIGLQSTGEARTLEQIDEFGDLNEFVSTARGVLQNLVEKHFPSYENLLPSSKTNPLTEQIKQQIAKQKKESKNSQKVNDILQRLSTYTNHAKKPEEKKLKLKKKSGTKRYRSSSMSSVSSNGSSIASNDTKQSSNPNSDMESDIETEFTDSFNESDDIDDTDPFKIHEACYDLDTEIKNNELSLNENLFDDSDDSDSLFSITKSVSVQSLMKNNKQKLSINLEKKFRKRKKKTKSQIPGYENEEEEEEDDVIDDDIIIEEKCEPNSSDDDFKLPTKRVKHVNIEETQKDELLTTCKPQPTAKPKPTQPYEISDYICELKRDLLNSIQQLGKRLPANTLDELIDLLDGPDKVAEMTGRKGRVVCRNNQDDTTNFVYETRNEQDVPVELMNVVQKERFMNGEKLIAIISEAASSGISLQANRRFANQCRRVHITIELPWSADRAIQQFGRTHRSNQVSAPEYVFLISELAGEKRFASTVAKRLESLGALTHGDRRATESRDLSRFNIDNKYGRSALENVIKSICNIEKPMAKLPKNYSGNFMKDAREALHGVGMIICNKNGLTAFPDKDYNSINKFLNRLLGCPVELQNAIFTFFSDVLAAVILEAKRTGKWDMGILDLGSNNEIVFRKETKFYVLNNNTESGKRVEMHTVLVERGLSYERALEIYKKSNQNNDELDNDLNKPEGFYISNQIKNNHKIAILAIQAQPLPNQSNKSIFLAIYRPNTGLQVRQETTESILKKYKKVTLVEAKPHWIEQYSKSSLECTHVYRQAHCANSRNCEIGLRTRRFHILAGSVLTVWSKVETTLSNLTCSSQFRLQIIRVKTDDNQKIVGCVIPTMCLKQIDTLLSSMSSKHYSVNHSNETNLTIKEEPVIEKNEILNPSKQITPVISFKTKSIFKVNSFSSINNNNKIINNNNIKFDNNIDLINYSNPIINYDYT